MKSRSESGKRGVFSLLGTRHLLPGCSLRVKLSALFVVLAATMLALGANNFYGLREYRALVNHLRCVEELAASAQLNRAVGQLRIATARHLKFQQLDRLGPERAPSPVTTLARAQVGDAIQLVQEKLQEYRRSLAASDPHGDFPTLTLAEQKILEELQLTLNGLVAEYAQPVPSPQVVRRLSRQLQRLTGKLPALLQRRLNALPDQVRSRYRAQITLGWTVTAVAALLLGVFVWQFACGVLRPMGSLIEGARHIAEGHWDFRFRVQGRDELALLARLLECMTRRFCRQRDRLDQAVQHHTQRAIQSQRLALLGLLAGKVAGQIHAPLATITRSASALLGWVNQEPELPVGSEQLEHLERIRTGAFECKRITDRLLHLARSTQPVRKPLRVSQLLDQVREEFAQWESHARVQLHPGPHSPWICAVEEELQHALLALLQTAVHWSGSSTSVHLTHTTSESEVWIFIRFELRPSSGSLRLHGAKSSKTTALDVAQAVLEEHQGRLELALRDPVVEFVVRLPCSCPSEPSQEVQDESQGCAQAA